MRDPNRIDPFMEELGMIWKDNCPDWRFGQLMFNAQRVMQSHGTDIFYMEDDKLLEYFREWFDMKEHNEKIHKDPEKYIKQFGTIEEWSKERNRKIF